MVITDQSKYALRMAKLSSKIFNQYIRPPVPRKISREVQIDPKEFEAWNSFHYHNEQLLARTSARPCEFDTYRNATYYPAHPQLKDLMATLRDHGLYRDEHKDILEEMSRLRAVRGKPDKVRASRYSKHKPPTLPSSAEADTDDNLDDQSNEA